MYRHYSLIPLALALALTAAAQAPHRMPDFQATTLTGEKLTKDTLKGKPFLLQFWTTWCNYCRGDQPAVEQFIKERGEQIPVICVSVDEPRADVTKYLAKAPRSCKVVLTKDTNLTSIVKPTGYPKYVLVDAKGYVGSIQNGAGGIQALREMLTEARIK